MNIFINAWAKRLVEKYCMVKETHACKQAFWGRYLLECIDISAGTNEMRKYKNHVRQSLCIHTIDRKYSWIDVLLCLAVTTCNHDETIRQLLQIDDMTMIIHTHTDWFLISRDKHKIFEIHTHKAPPFHLLPTWKVTCHFQIMAI